MDSNANSNADAGSKTGDGKTKGKRGVISELNHDTSFFSPIRSAAAQTQMGFGVLRRVFDTVAGGIQSAMAPGRRESFEEAMDRQNLTDNDLNQVYNQMAIEAIVLFGMAVLGFIVGVYFGFFAGLSSSALVAFFVSFACLARAGSCSFRNYQIRHRRLGMLSQWLGNPAEWVPGMVPAYKPPIAANDDKHKGSD